LIDERGINNEEPVGAVAYVIAFYTALVNVCGREKALDVYSKLTGELALPR